MCPEPPFPLCGGREFLNKEPRIRLLDVKAHLQDDLAQGAADSDVSVRVPTHVLVAVGQMADLVGIASFSEVLRGILASAKEDVLEEQDPEFAGSMERSISAVA